MPSLKNLNYSDTEPRVHEFKSAYAEHVGQDKLNCGHFSQFGKSHEKSESSMIASDDWISELMQEALQVKEQRLAEEKAKALAEDRKKIAGYMRQKQIKDKHGPKDY